MVSRGSTGDTTNLNAASATLEPCFTEFDQRYLVSFTWCVSRQTFKLTQCRPYGQSVDTVYSARCPEKSRDRFASTGAQQRQRLSPSTHRTSHLSASRFLMLVPSSSIPLVTTHAGAGNGTSSLSTSPTCRRAGSISGISITSSGPEKGCRTKRRRRQKEKSWRI